MELSFSSWHKLPIHVQQLNLKTTLQVREQRFSLTISVASVFAGGQQRKMAVGCGVV